jgi:hypothetical protein
VTQAYYAVEDGSITDNLPNTIQLVKKSVDGLKKSMNLGKDLRHITGMERDYDTLERMPEPTILKDFVFAAMIQLEVLKPNSETHAIWSAQY